MSTGPSIVKRQLNEPRNLLGGPRRTVTAFPKEGVKKRTEVWRGPRAGEGVRQGDRHGLTVGAAKGDADDDAPTGSAL